MQRSAVDSGSESSGGKGRGGGRGASRMSSPGRGTGSEGSTRSIFSQDPGLIANSISSDDALERRDQWPETRSPRRIRRQQVSRSEREPTGADPSKSSSSAENGSSASSSTADVRRLSLLEQIGQGASSSFARARPSLLESLAEGVTALWPHVEESRRPSSSDDSEHEDFSRFDCERATEPKEFSRFDHKKEVSSTQNGQEDFGRLDNKKLAQSLIRQDEEFSSLDEDHRHHEDSGTASDDEVTSNDRRGFREVSEDFYDPNDHPVQETRSSFVGINASELVANLRRLSEHLQLVSSPSGQDLHQTADEDTETDHQATDRESNFGYMSESSVEPRRSKPKRGSLITTELLITEAHLPFQQLLQEVPNPQGPGGIFAAFPQLRRLQAAIQGRSTGSEENYTQSSSSSGARASSSSAPPEDGRSPLFSAIVRSRLTANLINIYEAVSQDLVDDEIRLWDIFVDLDADLSGSLKAAGDSEDALRNALLKLGKSAIFVEACLRALKDRVDLATGICDFADLLDVWATEARAEQANQPFQNTIRRSIFSIGHLLGGTIGLTTSRASRASDLRARCVSKSSLALAEAVANYQRTLVLTSTWRCEQRLLTLLSTPDSPAFGSDAASQRGILAKLLSVLRGIHAELAPSERALWELLGLEDHDFDGALSKLEVTAALCQLLNYHRNFMLEQRNEGTEEFQELEELQMQCLERSVSSLFPDEQISTVSFASVLRWWWDIPEEYRVAAGLTMPAKHLRKSLQKQPEEMFRLHLRNAAADPPSAGKALRGHVRCFAELRALAVRRNLETFTSRSTAATGSTASEAGDFSSLTAMGDLPEGR